MKVTLSEVVEALGLESDAKVEGAPCEASEALGPYVDRVLSVLGYSDAWVSDLSMVGDFPVTTEDCVEFTRVLGVKVSVHDYLIDVAGRLRDMEPTQ